MARLKGREGDDLSFDAFPQKHASGARLAAPCERARAFVMGFDAADPTRISARSATAGPSASRPTCPRCARPRGGWRWGRS